MLVLAPAAAVPPTCALKEHDLAVGRLESSAQILVLGAKLA